MRRAVFDRIAAAAVWLAGLTFGLAACSRGDEAGDAASVVRDSAGVRIVENAGPAWTDRTAWRLSDRPLAVIGAVEGEAAALLDDVVGGVRLSDGSIVIANGGTRELRVYTVTGRHLRTFGGRGQGPGEFRWLRSLGRLPGDTLVVADLQPGRLNWFESGGRFLYQTVADIRGNERPLILADASTLVPVYDAGGFGAELELFAIGRREADDDGLYRPGFELVRVERGDARRDTVGRFAGAEIFKLDIGGRPVGAVRSRPYARRTDFAADTQRTFVAHTDRFEIRVYRTGGALEAVIRKPARSVTVSDEEKGLEADTLLARIREPLRPSYRRWLDAVPYPATKPVIDGMIVDAAGHLWVREPRAHGAATDPWSVFSPDGRLLGEVAVPAGHELLEIGDDQVLALWRDELRVEYVGLYALTRAR